MADLDFSHKVQEVPAGQKLPEGYQRNVKTEISNVPDLQGAINKYAESTNWMSEVGSAVASKASNAIASKLGGEAGKHPTGALQPSFTDFDKQFAQSYNAQAQATLGIQANKLISDSNIQMAKANRITPDLIASTNKNISIGLQNIFKNAPAEVRTKLEYHYSAQQISQVEQLTDRMIREQKQDHRSNTAYASEVNAESAQSLAQRGLYDQADAVVENTQYMNEVEASNDPSYKHEAKSKIDAVRQAAATGKLIHKYENSRYVGKGEEFINSLADNISNNKLEGVKDSDVQSVINNFTRYVHNQQNLRHSDAALASAKFNVALAEDPTAITPAQIDELNSHLDPLQQQEASLAYVKAIRAIQKKTDGMQQALSVYTNTNEFPLQKDENKNAAWETNYKSIMQRPESVSSGMTEDTAKLYAAAAAPVAIPAYVKQLNALASSADPRQLEAAGQAYNYMMTNKMGAKLAGMGDQQKAMLETYGSLRQFMPTVEAAQKAHETIYNKSKEQKEANQEALSTFLSSQKAKNESAWGIIKRLIDTPTNLKIRNLPGYTQKANQTFSRFFNITNGDEATSTKLTKQYMESQYGVSNINGEEEYAFQPIENIPGIPHGATGAVQSDIVEQANFKFQHDKKLFDENKSDVWWEARQRISPQEAMTSKKIVDAVQQGNIKHPISGALFDVHSKRQEYNKHLKIIETYNNQPITIVKHNRSGKDEVFEGAVQANPWGVATGNPNRPISGGWDLQIKTENGFNSIPQMDPLNSTVQYNPRVDLIQKIHSHTKGNSIFKQLTADNIKDLATSLKGIKQ